MTNLREHTNPSFVNRYEPIVDPIKLDFWINNGLTVIFDGHKGVGKTAIIKQIAEKHNLKSLFIGGATMDFFLDFIGLPNITEKEGRKCVEYIKPDFIDYDNVEFIFIDEFNRAPKAMKNATMELLQFRSVNGVKFPKLRTIWAAINPDENGYDVDPMDEAQLDRFVVQYKMDYRPCYKHFSETYGDSVAFSLIDWWFEMSPELQKQISPRRLEYAIQYYQLGGDPNDILPEKSNVEKFVFCLDSDNIESKMRNIVKRYFSGEDVETEIFEIVRNDNYIEPMIQISENNDDISELFLGRVSKERLVSLASDTEPIKDYIVKNFDKFHTTLRISLENKSNLDVVERAVVRRFFENPDSVFFEGIGSEYFNFGACPYTNPYGNFSDQYYNGVISDYNIYSLKADQARLILIKLNSPDKGGIGTNTNKELLEKAFDLFIRASNVRMREKLTQETYYIELMNKMVYCFLAHGYSINEIWGNLQKIEIIKELMITYPEKIFIKRPIK